MNTVLESLQAGLENALAVDSRVVVLGEDILDPYGGAFKVTRGLSTKYPDRIMTTPVSEAGIVGVAAGMAVRGLRPVVEIMFGDFLTLTADQLINHASKFRWIYADQVRVPLVVRTPMGGRRGYGPTHSQSLEKLFLGVPGLHVVAPAAFGDPGSLLKQAILEDDDPVLFVENKLLYLLPIFQPQEQPDLDFKELSPEQTQNQPTGETKQPEYPLYHLRVRSAPPPVLTIIAYGYMAELCRQALLRLAYEEEIFAELFIPTQLAPYRLDPVLDSARRTGRLLVVEEGSLTMGWGAEVLACASESLGSTLRSARRVAAANLPIPAAAVLESAVLPDVEGIFMAAKSLL
jgi:pyruvate/2-oxoglutarate/acetoin dehydrogenase E1 component